MQTPLMELIEIIDREALDNTGFYTPGEFEVMASVKKHATELLEKERELARHAFLNAINMGDDISPKTANELFEDYYTKTFTNESK